MKPFRLLVFAALGLPSAILADPSERRAIALELRQSQSEIIAVVNTTENQFRRADNAVISSISFAGEPLYFKGAGLSNPFELEIHADVGLVPPLTVRSAGGEYLLLFATKPRSAKGRYVPTVALEAGFIFRLSSRPNARSLREFLLSQLASPDRANVETALLAISKTSDQTLLDAVKRVATGQKDEETALIAKRFLQASDTASQEASDHLPLNEAAVKQLGELFTTWVNFLNAESWKDLISLYSSESETVASWNKGGKEKAEVLQLLQELRREGSIMGTQPKSTHQLSGKILQVYTCGLGAQSTITFYFVVVHDKRGRQAIDSVRWDKPKPKASQ